jgi:hypothetical protein
MEKRRAKQSAPRWKRKRGRIPGYTPEAETAEELSVTKRTLRKWRQLGIGPPYVEVARQYHYSDQGRAAWVKGREVQPVRSGQRHSETEEATA